RPGRGHPHREARYPRQRVDGDRNRSRARHDAPREVRRCHRQRRRPRPRPLAPPPPARPFRAVGNLPYNVGTPILRRVIADPNFRRAVFMLQKEVADRLAAKPGDEQYGYLTLYTRLFASARILMTLDPGSFHPRPKVRSAV